MNFKRAKIFNKENRIHIIEYKQNDDYYSFIKDNSEQGFEQVILTTDFMLAILKHYFLKRNFVIKEILPIDEDPFLVDKFKSYLEKIEEDRGQFAYLLSEMDFLLHEKNALDIFKIELSGKSLSDERIRFNVQINGVVQIKDTCYEEEKEELIKVITAHFGWEI